MLEDSVTGILSNCEDTFKNLNEIVKKGNVIALRHSAIFHPILNVIQEIEDNNIYFKIPDDFLKYNVMQGDDAYCHFFYETDEYVVFGKIADIDPNAPKMYKLTVNKIMKFKNNRKSRRFFVNFQAFIRLPDKRKRQYGIIKNISNNGISLVFKEKVEVDALIDIEIIVNHDNHEKINLKARVVRSIQRDMFSEYGLEITQVSRKDNEILESIIDKLLVDEALFVAQSLK